jgi:sigma-B regulation protein RsbU (phosphoserine phosphatase)
MSVDSNPPAESGIGTTTMALRSAFARLSPSELKQLREFAHFKTYPADTILCHEGELEHILYVMQSGVVKVTQQMPDGQEHLLTMRGPGEFFGEMALIDKSPRSASVTAVTEVAVVEITQEIFDQVLSRSPTLALLLLRQSVSMLRNSMQQQISELQEKNQALEKAYRELQAAQAELLRGERMKRDLEVAAQMQRAILPLTFPKRPGLAFAAHAQPAREVGGDFYDVIDLDPDHLGLLVADVSDKSIHAAMFMAVSRALFLTEARRSQVPTDVVQAVNEMLLEVSSSDDMFVTAFYGVLDVRERSLTYVRAGHDKPLLLHIDGQLELLDGAGRFLGMLPGLQVEERVVKLAAGDRLVMFSDGVPDATNQAGEAYSTARAMQLSVSQRTGSAHDLADALFADVLAFQGDAPQFDDITILVTALD